MGFRLFYDKQSQGIKVAIWGGAFAIVTATIAVIPSIISAFTKSEGNLPAKFNVVGGTSIAYGNGVSNQSVTITDNSVTAGNGAIVVTGGSTYNANPRQDPQPPLLKIVNIKVTDGGTKSSIVEVAMQSFSRDARIIATTPQITIERNSIETSVINREFEVMPGQIGSFPFGFLPTMRDRKSGQISPSSILIQDILNGILSVTTKVYMRDESRNWFSSTSVWRYRDGVAREESASGVIPEKGPPSFLSK